MSAAKTPGQVVGIADREKHPKPRFLDEVMQIAVGSLLCSHPCRDALSSLLSRQKRCVNRQMARGGGSCNKDVGNNRGCHHHIFGPHPRQEKTLILALHNKCNIIRTSYNLVLLEIQVVWTGVHFLYASK